MGTTTSKQKTTETTETTETDEPLNYQTNFLLDAPPPFKMDLLPSLPQMSLSKQTGGITFVRHSYSCANAIKGMNYKLRDPKLTDNGLKEAKSVCNKKYWFTNNKFDINNEKPWFIFSSELTRSIETAVSISECIKQNQNQQKKNVVIVAPYLNELNKHRFGTLDNKPRSKKHHTEKEYQHDIDWKVKPREEGASPSIKKFILWMNKEYPKWNSSNVVVVTHSSLIFNDLPNIKLDNLGTVPTKVTIEGQDVTIKPIYTDPLPGPRQEEFEDGVDRCEFDRLEKWFYRRRQKKRQGGNEERSPDRRSNERSTDRSIQSSTDDESTDKRSADKRSADKRSTDEKSADDKSTDDESTDDESTDDSDTDTIVTSSIESDIGDIYSDIDTDDNDSDTDESE